MRPLIFMSGQLSTVAALAITAGWGFVRNARKLTSKGDGFVLDGWCHQPWKGAIYYAADPNVERATNNLEVLSSHPCWPDPKKLLRMVDRQVVAKECIDQGFFGKDPCAVSTWADYLNDSEVGRIETFDVVIKVGNEHSGEGKLLIPAGSPFLEWEGISTIQPFFKGRSIRVLHIEENVFFIETKHEFSWIKNSPGGENTQIDSIPTEMFEHSLKVRDHFGLDVCGNDYILSNDGSFHFLETNQFPGLGEDFLGDLPRTFFCERMRSLEKIVASDENVQRSTVPPSS